MQRIDYYLGVPLCFLLSFFEFFRRLVFSDTNLHPKKILFIELSEMGSAFLAYPMLKKAASDFGSENLYFLIFTKNRESVDLLEVLPKENVITISDTNFPSFVIGTLKALIQIWKIRIDTTIDMELFSRATAIISFFTFAKTKVGFDNFTDEGLYRGNFINHRVLLNNHQHISVNFLALYEGMFSDQKELPQVKKNLQQHLCDLPVIKPSQIEKDNSWQLLVKLNSQINQDSTLIVLNPDPGLLDLRGWPTKNYMQTAEELLKTIPNSFIILMGLPRSSHYAKLVFPDAYLDRCINFCGQTSNLKDVTTLFSFCHLLITNDSGPAHLATLADIPSIILFGPETPNRYGPLNKNANSLFANLSCSPCYTAANHRHSICTNNRCMQAIPVNQVVTLAQQILKKQVQ